MSEPIKKLTPEAQDALNYVFKFVSKRLSEIESQFMKPNFVTLIVRRPDAPEQDFLVTSEVGFDELEKLIARRKAASGNGARQGPQGQPEGKTNE